MMTSQEVILKLNDHDHEITSLKHRMDDAEEKQEDNIQLTLSVSELANNMKHMLEVQKEQSELLISKSVEASLSLAIATAKAVKRTPDAKCNGDMIDTYQFPFCTSYLWLNASPIYLL